MIIKKFISLTRNFGLTACKYKTIDAEKLESLLKEMKNCINEGLIEDMYVRTIIHRAEETIDNIDVAAYESFQMDTLITFLYNIDDLELKYNLKERK